MTVEFTDEQFALLKTVVAEYAEECYHAIFDCKQAELAAPEESVKKAYADMALEEEAAFKEAKALSEYLENA